MAKQQTDKKAARTVTAQDRLNNAAAQVKRLLGVEQQSLADAIAAQKWTHLAHIDAQIQGLSAALRHLHVERVSTKSDIEKLSETFRAYAQEAEQKRDGCVTDEDYTHVASYEGMSCAWLKVSLAVLESIDA